ncbi:26S proteasome regulatory subunit RPN9 [Astathelohania contejeani]|uniref:26S proteasome regulatory subunit RPN9 n=1 Tax=Astathelohania contejeani TaxID=164912 RepID=A0ABQ7I179_9MICR|nr:26S proteasome regulatory subunit RPN9 [Thelohania contejeani]
MLNELYKEKKWYDLCQEIIRVQSEGKPLISEVMNLVLPNSKQIHPTDYTNAILSTLPYLDPEAKLSLLSEAQMQLESKSLKQHSREYRLLEIHKQTILMDVQFQPETIEQHIFEWQDCQDECYLQMALKYYEKTENYEECYNTIIKMKKNIPLDKFIIYALLSRKVFNFSNFAFFEGDNKILFEIVSEFQEGKMSPLINEIAILKQHSTFLEQKLNLIRLINLCFNSTRKMLSFSEIEEKLGVDSAIPLLVQALGLGVVSGVINGEERIFEFTHVIPRVLTKEELIEMKNKFSIWRRKVGNAIKAIETQ